MMNIIRQSIFKNIYNDKWMANQNIDT